MLAATVVPQFLAISNQDGTRVAKVGLGGRFLVNAYLANTDDLQGPTGPKGEQKARSDRRGHKVSKGLRAQRGLRVHKEILGLRGRATVNKVFRASRDLRDYRVRLILWASMGRKANRGLRVIPDLKARSVQRATLA